MWIAEECGRTQVEALRADKRAIAKVLQQRETELEDLHTRLRQTLVGIDCDHAVSLPHICTVEALHW